MIDAKILQILVLKYNLNRKRKDLKILFDIILIIVHFIIISGIVLLGDIIHNYRYKSLGLCRK